MGLEMEGLEPQPVMNQGFSSAQEPTWPYWWRGQVSSCWSRSPEGQVWAGSFSSSSSFSQYWHPCPRVGTWCAYGLGLWRSWPQSGSWTTPSVLPLREPVIAVRTPFRCCSVSEPISHSWALPSAPAVLTLVWICITKQAGPQQVLGSGWDKHWGDRRKLARVSCSFNLLSLPGFWSKQACMYSSGVESGFLTTLLLVPLVFKPARGTHLPSVRPQGWGRPIYGSNCSLPREDP